jgi:O-antigen/teichoic acid export membrane protein
MGLHRRIAMNVMVSYVARGLQILLSLVLIPVMYRHLDIEVIGMWMLLSQATLFLGLLDFGFGPTLTRRIAFAKGLSGEHVDVELTAESRAKLGDLLRTGRVVFRVLALVIFLLAGCGGTLLLKQVPLQRLAWGQVLGAWALFCVSYAINVWSGLWLTLLSGLGYVGGANLITTIMLVVAAVGKILAVSCGGSLVSLAVIDCVAAVATRQLLRAYFLWKEGHILQLPGRWSSGEFRSIVEPALKFWFTALAAFLVLKTDEIFITYFKGTEAIPDYRSTYMVINCLYNLAITFSLVAMPFYSQLWQAGSLSTLQAILMRNLALALGLMLSGLTAVVMSSPSLFNLWLGPGHFVGFAILIVFCTMLFLETQHVTFTYAARSTEDEVYALCALAAGTLNLILTWFLGKRYGLLGIAMGTMLAQMATSNWYCVHHSLERLQLSFRVYAARVLAPLAGLLSASTLPLLLALPHLPLLPFPWSDWLRVAVVCAWCGAVLAAFLWRFAISAEERLRLLMTIKSNPRFGMLRRLMAR